MIHVDLYSQHLILSVFKFSYLDVWIGQHQWFYLTNALKTDEINYLLYVSWSLGYSPLMKTCSSIFPFFPIDFPHFFIFLICGMFYIVLRFFFFFLVKGIQISPSLWRASSFFKEIFVKNLWSWMWYHHCPIRSDWERVVLNKCISWHVYISCLLEMYCLVFNI